MADNPTARYVNRDINRILDILGTTQTHLWLFTAGPNDATSLVPCIGTAPVLYNTSDEAAVRNVNAEFGPVLLPSGLYAYHFDVAGNQHIAASADDAAHTFGNGTADMFLDATPRPLDSIVGTGGKSFNHLA